jgi:hypothetical protein
MVRDQEVDETLSSTTGSGGEKRPNGAKIPDRVPTIARRVNRPRRDQNQWPPEFDRQESDQ